VQRTDALVVGGGQAGLAMSRCLTDLGVDHVVLERGRIAQRWRSERWDSLRLLTPSWLSRLPGFSYRGADPDGYMDMAQVIEHLQTYARSFAAPVLTETTVRSLRASHGGFRIDTDRDRFSARAVVLATGHCDAPLVPSLAAGLPSGLLQISPTGYRNPDQLPTGGVLVVGASASGVQIAHELRSAGREVTLAVGRHTRLPRLHRGRDIMWWLDRLGILDERASQVADIRASRATPSMQLAGRHDRADLDLPALQAIGVRLVGRATASEGARIRFADDLPKTVRRADAKLRRLVDRIEQLARRDPELLAFEGEPARIVAADVRNAISSIDLVDEGISTVVWATGFRRRYPWLHVPVVDGAGELVHEGGITRVPGLYALGLRFMRRRSSSFIDGVGRDATEIAAHLRAMLDRRSSLAA
jgi:putative flavoprotein involved in K+ transport